MTYTPGDAGEYGISHIISNCGAVLKIQRNVPVGYAVKYQDDESGEYFIKVTTGTNYGFIGVSEDDMIALCRAFLEIRRDLEENP
jgi:hypothetical protein